ncbi:hypothetical protein EB796_008152 [Bugula neritina]|uniref:Uncharacterized protein n=1 Tax=Bugula neritina TaxID=10212 RepID=A0A7J7K4H8_BUGNE|nr:hypothetical protein EB796_008152 [Bugula neritina]
MVQYLHIRYNVVDKSEESKRKLRSIKNVIGDYICRLCDTKYASVYDLAEHRCPSIIYIEYKCPECSKVFNCPANLASIDFGTNQNLQQIHYQTAQNTERRQLLSK